METWGDKSNPEPDTDGSDNEDDLCKKVNNRKEINSPKNRPYIDRGFNGGGDSSSFGKCRK
jgi:hypothetical protein